MRVLVAAVVLFAATPATAQENDAGENRPENQLLTRLLDQIEHLQDELREVRDRNDRQARALRALGRKVRELEGRLAASPANAAPAAPAAPAANAVRPAAMEREAAGADAPAMATSARAWMPRTQTPAAGGTEPSPAAARAAAGGAGRAPSDGRRPDFFPKDEMTPEERDERQAYRRATRALNDDDYASLRRELEAFLQSWPHGKYAADAKFWIGEAWYAERNLDQAEHYYKRVAEENAAHHKSEDARLKLAYIHMERDQRDAAGAVLQELARVAVQDRIRALAHKKLEQVHQRER